MAIKEWKDVVSVDFPKDGTVTDSTIETTKRNTRRFRGSVRISMGKIWKSGDFEKWRAAVLRTPLP